MIIELPRKFFMEGQNNSKGAFIEDGVLKISRDVSFRRVMTEITYQIKGKHRCCYCREKIGKDEVTIDHMYPQEFGGPTITNNMLPSCKKCNNEKGNLNTSQYKAFLKAKEKGEIDEFKKKIKQYQNYIREWIEFDIPQEWLGVEEISSLIVIFDLDENYKSKKYQKIVKYYEKYQHFQKPIIIDKNGFVLDGFLAVMYAKNTGIKKLPVIQLDNVEIIL